MKMKSLVFGLGLALSVSAAHAESFSVAGSNTVLTPLKGDSPVTACVSRGVPGQLYIVFYPTNSCTSKSWCGTQATFRADNSGNGCVTLYGDPNAYYVTNGWYLKPGNYRVALQINPSKGAHSYKTVASTTIQVVAR